MRGLRCKLGTVALVVAVGALALATAASGADRYASSTGDDSDTSCPLVDPCDIVTAIETFPVADGDTVIVLSDGDYNLPEMINVNDAITIRGQVGQPRPRLIRDQDAIEVNNAGATLRRLYIESNTAGVTTLTANGTALLEQLELVAHAPIAHAAFLRDGARLRDSVAWLDFDVALRGAVLTGGTGATLTNVTAIGAGTMSEGIEIRTGNGSNQVVTLRNVIARGVTAGIRAVNSNAPTEGDDNVDVNVSFTNYSSIIEDEPDADVIEGAGNQTVAPMFVDAPSLDFAQLAASITRNAGSPDGTIGALDFDGEPRTMGAAIDIGADEFTEAAPTPTPPAADTSAPTASLSGKKKQGLGKNVVVKVVSSEDGTADASGQLKLKGGGKGSSALAAVKKSALKLKPASADLTADQRTKMKLRVKKKGRKAVKKALKRGQKAKAKMTVEVTDASGNLTTAKRTVKLKLK